MTLLTPYLTASSLTHVEQTFSRSELIIYMGIGFMLGSFVTILLLITLDLFRMYNQSRHHDEEQED